LSANPLAAEDFSVRLIAWQKRAGRHTLPWQGKAGQRPHAYHVWLSEVMLQQTQVATVIDYFKRFLARFPTVHELASAPQDDVLALWSGLGYYSRARNLHRAAQLVVAQFQGEFPSDTQALQTLPGVGRSTAGAIAALAYGKKAAILDGNVKRVLSRVYAISAQSNSAIEKQSWEYAEKLLPDAGIEAYTQGLMDLGATLCTRSKPRCSECPFERNCIAHRQGQESAFPVKLKKKSDSDKAVDANTKTTRRSKQAVLLLLYSGNELLLERRPESGIWGGLWSAPEFDSAELALAAAAQRGRIKEHHLGIEAKHSFTHFDLYATPLNVQLDEVTQHVAEQDQRWVSREAALAMGIPALLRKWLSV
jgi:A/G-specific adenine glycosylase